MTLAPVRPARTRHHAPPARTCAWTRAGQWQLGLDLPWQVRLPGWTPLGDCGVQVAVRCHSADPTLRIGGDWHLSMPLPGGDLLLAVGDVGGHGLSAAVEMLRLRYAMASFATACADPAAILCHLNQALCRRGDATATAVAARFSPGSGELAWAQAGHPPVIAASGDRVRPLPSPAGTMLGVIPHARYERATARLRPGDFIVLYTDGVFRRRESVDEGIDAMARLAASARFCPPALLDHVDYGAAGDDACVLVAERVR